MAFHPKGSPEIATRSWLELEGYSDIGKREPIWIIKKVKAWLLCMR